MISISRFMDRCFCFIRYSGSELSDLQCMLQRDEAHLWVAGHQGLMLEVDLKKGVVSNKVINNSNKFFSVRSLQWKAMLHISLNMSSIFPHVPQYFWKNTSVMR